jgi:predicted membrane protein (TIGR00267 family)
MSGSVAVEGHKPHKKGNKLSDVILGGQDGLVNVLGLMLGLAAATNSSRVIIAGGLAATFAESLSMAAVAYTSKMAGRDHYYSERAQEVKEVKEVPEIETQEIRDIYAAKGFQGRLLEEIVTHITSDHELWIDTMMREELNLLPVVKHDIYIYSFNVGTSTLIGSLLPLIPFFFLAIHLAIIIAIMISILSLASVGVYKARTLVGNPFKSALQMVLIGIGAAIAGYLIGLVFKS